MRYRDVAGMEVSALCLGTMLFGTKVDEATSFAILDRFVESGGSFLDTANNYAFWMPDATGSESETTLGRWLAARGARDDVVIGSKVGARPRTPGDRTLDDLEGLSPRTIRSAIAGSLQRPSCSTATATSSRATTFRCPTGATSTSRRNTSTICGATPV